MDAPPTTPEPAAERRPELRAPADRGTARPRGPRNTASRRTFRTSAWILALVAAGLALSVAGFLVFRTEPDEVWTTLGFAGLGIAFATGLLEAATARVVLEPEALEVVSNFRRRRIPRSDVVCAVGEKGVPVAIELRTGGWYKLPTLGTGPHANTLRAWIRRQVEPPAEG